MTRNLLIFFATFAFGALIAFAARTALHKPHSVAGEHTAPDRAPMVGNALTPAPAAAGQDSTHATHEKAPATNPAPASPKTSAHDHHGAVSTPAESSSKTVNTQCAICGMAVDPSLPTLEYQGKTIGFGCKMCAPKFKADPDKYGPIYLRNEVIKR